MCTYQKPLCTLPSRRKTGLRCVSAVAFVHFSLATVLLPRFVEEGFGLGSNLLRVIYSANWFGTVFYLTYLR